MSARLVFSDEVIKRLGKLDQHTRKRIFLKIEALESNPRQGKLLAGDKKGLRSLRLGDYRILYEINPPAIVYVKTLAHRRKVYKR